jgi:hypothetical protein
MHGKTTIKIKTRYLFVSKCHSVTDETDDPATNMYKEIYRVITFIPTPKMEEHVLPKV